MRHGRSRTGLQDASDRGCASLPARSTCPARSTQPARSADLLHQGPTHTATLPTQRAFQLSGASIPWRGGHPTHGNERRRARPNVPIACKTQAVPPASAAVGAPHAERTPTNERYSRMFSRLHPNEKAPGCDDDSSHMIRPCPTESPPLLKAENA